MFSNAALGNSGFSWAIRRTLPVPMRAAGGNWLRSFVDLRVLRGSRAVPFVDLPVLFVDLRVIPFVDLGRKHQRIAWILALENGADIQAIGQHRRHVFAAVNGEIDVAAEKGLFNFLDEQPLAADVRQRRFLQPISRGLDDDDLRSLSICRGQALGDQPRLEQRERAPAAAKTEGGHCAGFFGARVTPAVVSVASSAGSSPVR